MEKLLQEIKTNIEQIEQNFKYTNFIHKVIFENYANIAKDETINFTFPLTALVGKNGCNKTRVLQALYGVPEGKTVGDFWFSTSLDPIVDKDPNKGNPKYIYVYSTTNDENSRLPVYYNRIFTKTKNDPDYWETRNLTKKLKLEYGIPDNQNKCDPIIKNCIFIDSKIELSAYDIFFNFNGRESGKRTNYRDNKRFIRSKAEYIKSNIENKNIRYAAHKSPQNEIPKELTKQHLHWISKILGKNYDEIVQIFHKHYRFWGDSLFLNKEYSEARAGSGELKVVNMVRQILDAPHHSLILLDEPEISLHPGAQLELLNFFLEQIKRKNHQIVFTTHSPTMIKNLPPSAIRLFTKNVGAKSFSIKENVSPIVAFMDFGETVSQKKNVFVEDETAKLIIDKIIENSSDLTPDAFNILYTPGGAEDLLASTVPNFMYSPSNNYFILDGDKNKKTDDLNHLKISLKSLESPDNYNIELTRIILGLTNIHPDKIKFSKNSRHTTEDDNALFVEYLKFYDSNIFFLPGALPEDLLWTIDANLPLFSDDKKLFELNSDNTINSKQKIYDYALFLAKDNKDSAGQLFSVLREQLADFFVQTKNQDFQAIENMLKFIQNN